MSIVLTILHVLICFFLIVVVLLQSGKAADLAGAFGGMGSQTAFGPRGSATVLSKATTVAAALFMVTSLTLAILGTRGAVSSRTVLESEAATQSAPAPAPANPAEGAPSVTLTDPRTGESRTMPVEIPASGQGQQESTASEPPGEQ